MGTVYDKLVDQAEAMVNIINKKYIAGNRMAYLALLSGVGSCRIESYPGAGHNYQQSWMRFIIATQEIIHQGLIQAIEMVCTL